MDRLKTPTSTIKFKTPKKLIKKLNNSQTDNVEVFCRIRPLEASNELACAKKLSQNIIALTPLEASNVSTKQGLTYKESQFTFQDVFSDDISQKDIFDRIAFPMVDDFLHGKNGVLFTYGVTCSGKTYTMNGTANDKGILPRSLDCIFNSISDYLAKKYTFKVDKMNGFDIQSENDANEDRLARDSSKSNRNNKINNNAVSRDDEAKIEGLDYDSLYSIFVSYIEIYNNYVYDLLEDTPVDPISGAKPPISKTVREDSDKNMFVSGVVELEVTSSEEAIDLINKGQKRRKVAHTNLNSESSRSHSIFSVRLVQGPVDPSGEYVLLDKKKLLLSQLSLVDLAGSERTLRTGNMGDRLKEAGNINQSLMVLRTCIEVLRENQKNNTNKMVPYRDSRLTLLFKTYFEGKGKVKMIICVNPKMSDYEENINVMKFAELTQEVQIARPQVIKPDIAGLNSGRRLANLQLKETLAQNIETQESNRLTFYSLGPPFPVIQLDEANNNAILPFVMKFLKEKEACRKNLLADLAVKEDSFRINLTEMEAENTILQQKVDLMEEQARLRDEALSEANRLIATRDQYNTVLQSRIAVYDLERRQLEKELGENSWKMMMEKVEKDRLIDEYKQKFNQAQQQYNMTLEQAKRRIKEESSAKVRSKQQKLDMLKAILAADSDSGSSSEPPSSSIRGIARSKAYPSMCDVNCPPYVPPADDFKTPLYRKNMAPPAIRTKPILTNRRRSKSSDAQTAEIKIENIFNPGTQSRIKTEIKDSKLKDNNMLDIKKKKVPTATMR